jgi:lipopolysaccharide export system protein LptC
MADADLRRETGPSGVRGARIPVFSGKRRLSRGYGRVVGLLKVVLPTVAVVLIGIAILWPYLEDERRQLVESLTDAGQLITEHLEVVEASYSGVGDDGQRYTVTAETVQQQSVDAMLVKFTQPRADISLTDGSWALVTAANGMLDRDTQVLELHDGVNLFHDQGYEFETQSATFDLLEGSAYGFDPVSGQGPFGYLEAEGFQALNRGAQVQLTGRSRVVIYETD